MTIKNGAKKTFSLEELSEMMELLKNNKSNSSSEVDDSIEDEDEDDEPEDDSNSSSEVDDSIEDDVSVDDILEDEPEDDSNSSSEVDDSIEDEPEDEAPEENVSELNRKIDKLASDFKVFSNKIIPMLEALLAAQRIAIGIKGDETPRVTKEKKVLAKLNTASGKLKKEVAAVLLVINDEGVLKATSKSAYISKGRAVEEELEFEGKIPNGNWIVVEKSDKYYLVDVENFSNAQDVTPYETESEDDNESSNGIVVNKKGVANNCRGYKLESRDEDFRLTKRSLEKPFKVFNAKWTKNCNNSWPITGEAIPEGTWVIVEDEEENYFLVESKNVEPTISTKKTEKKVVKKVVKTAKKTAKKVAKKNKKK